MKYSGVISTAVLFIIVFTSNINVNFGYFKAGIFTSNTRNMQEKCPKV